MEKICRWYFQQNKESIRHLNSQHPRIKFTSEIQDEEKKISYLDTLVHIEEDKSIKITIYYYTIHRPIPLFPIKSPYQTNKRIGIISTFRHRINELVTKEEDKVKEEKHVTKAF